VHTLPVQVMPVQHCEVSVQEFPTVVQVPPVVHTPA
jgi:hypothetical protein